MDIDKKTPVAKDNKVKGYIGECFSQELFTSSHSPCNLPIFDPIVKMSEKANVLERNLPSPSRACPRMRLPTKKPQRVFYLFRPGVCNSRTDTDYDARQAAAARR